MVNQEGTLKALDKLKKLEEFEKEIKGAREAFAGVANALSQPLQTRLIPEAPVGYGSKYNLSSLKLPDLKDIGKTLRDLQRLHYDLTVNTPKDIDSNVRQTIKSKLAEYD